MEKSKQRSIILLGLMGSGKTIIGKNIAKKLNYTFYDTDTLIEQKQEKTINEIFKTFGEKYFRKIEEEIILRVLNEPLSVISLGGGSILSPKIRKKLKKNSFTIYLKVKIDILVKRLKNSKKRPLLSNVDIKKKLITIHSNRKKYYEDANLTINNSESIQDTIIEIVNYLSKKNE